MSQWRVLLAVLMLLALGIPAGHARNLVIFSQSGLTILKGKVVGPFLQRHVSGLQHLEAPNVSPSLMCDTCMDISAFVEQVLTDPDTMGDVLEYVNGSLCKALSGFQEECINLAKIYVPGLVETLQVYAAPDKLCGETKLCPSSAMLLLNDARACKMCMEYATEALSYAQDSKTEEEIMNALHSQCAKLGDFSSRCDMLVDTYGPIYISKLDSTTPEQVCQKVGICSAPSIKDPSNCATCEFAVYQLKAKLRNPAVQDKMLETLLDHCTKVPAHVDQCKELVTQYGPLILANIDTYVDPKTICTEIHACDSKKKLSDDMLIQLPVTHASIAHL